MTETVSIETIPSAESTGATMPVGRSSMLMPALSAAAVEMFGEKFCGEFSAVLTRLLKEGRAHDFIRYCYEGGGAEKWDDTVAWGQQSRYTIPSDEAHLLYKSKELIARLFAPLRPFGIMAGPGSSWAILHKEVPTHRAALTSGAISWDFNKKNADIGAMLGGIEAQINIQPVVGDFLQGLPQNATLPKDERQPFLLTIFGSTLTQFAKTGDTSLHALLTSFGNATNYNGFILGTLDGNQTPRNVESCYSGEHFTAWQEEIWSLTKFITGDDDFEPKAIKYRPRYNSETLSLEHVHEVVQGTSLRLPGEKRRTLERGRDLIIGVSQKWGAKDIAYDCHKAGWDQFLVLRNGSSVCAVGYVGKNTPMNIRQQVETAINEISGHDLVIWSGSVVKPVIAPCASPN